MVVLGFLPFFTVFGPEVLVAVGLHSTYRLGLQAALAVSAETTTNPADSRNPATMPEMSFFIGLPMRNFRSGAAIQPHRLGMRGADRPIASRPRTRIYADDIGRSAGFAQIRSPDADSDPFGLLPMTSGTRH